MSRRARTRQRPVDAHTRAASVIAISSATQQDQASGKAKALRVMWWDRCWPCTVCGWAVRRLCLCHAPFEEDLVSPAHCCMLCGRDVL